MRKQTLPTDESTKPRWRRRTLSLAVGPKLPAAQVRKLIDTCWHVEQLPSAAAIAKAAVRRT